MLTIYLYKMLRLLLLAYYSLVGIVAHAQITRTETHLPILRITVADSIPDEPKISAHLAVIDRGVAGPNRPTDSPTGYDGVIGIELRGQTSRGWPKQSYGIETRKADGSNNNVALLGLPTENDWVLYAPFHDRSLLRNVFVYGLGRRLLAWSPRTRYVELWLNDDYRGVYVLTEKIKRDRNRVAIAELEEEDNSGMALTGGYLLKIDKGIDSTGQNHFLSAYSESAYPDYATVDVLFVDPKSEELTPAQRTYIETYFHAFEAALRGPDFADPQTGYAAFVDVGSFVDYLILSELSGNLDAYRVSTYFHKPRGGKLTMGPLWDYNFALGSTRFCEADDAQQWRYAFNAVCPDDRWLVPFWWERLLEDLTFATRLRRRYTALRTGPLHRDSLHQMLDRQVQELGTAAARDYARWPGTRWLVPYTAVGHRAESDALYAWLDRRLAFLDDEWLLPVLPPTVEWRVPSGPAGRPIEVWFTLEDATAVTLQLRDLTGRLHWSGALQLPAGTFARRLPVTPPPGTYLLHWQTADQAPEAQLLVRY